MQLISQRLRRRTTTAGADPLVTYYDLGTGERTELSAVTVTNWVNKTCHLLVDEYGLDLGDLVELDVARTHPGHWVTICLELACWTLGATVTVDGGADDDAGAEVRLVIAGPLYSTAAEHASALGADLLACSLHPLGLPFAERLPDGVADFSLEVRGQPDQYAAAAVPGEELAWRSAEAARTQTELAVERESTQRRLLRPSTPWATARDGIVAALIGGGSVVLAVGDDEAALDRIRETENIDGEVGRRGDRLMLVVDTSSAVPPFEQLRQQLLAQIETGELPPGTQLPTVRRLAGDLGIAPNTVARTYRELEQAGLVRTAGRRGTVVAEPSTDVGEDARRSASDFVQRMRALGLNPTETLQLVRQAFDH